MINVSAIYMYSQLAFNNLHVCSGQDVEMWALELQRGNSPTTKMIMELGSKAMNVKELVEILHELQIEVLLKEFLLPRRFELFVFVDIFTDLFVHISKYV